MSQYIPTAADLATTENMTGTLNLTDFVNKTDGFNITDIFNQTDTAENLTTTTALFDPFGDPSCDHIPGLVSREMYRKFEVFRIWYAGVFGYVMSSICAVGTVTCAMAVIVLTRKNMNFSGSIILTWLAVAELMKSASYLPYIVNAYLVLSRDRFGYPHSAPEKGWAIYHLSAVIVSTMCNNISVGLTISLAVFRCIYILFPNKSPRYCSIFRSKLTVIITISCGFVINMPIYYIFTWYLDPYASTGTYLILPRDEVEQIWFDTYYFINSVLIKLAPSALLIALTTILISAMSRTFKNRQEEERRVTNMLLSVVLLFTFSGSFHALLIVLSKWVKCFEEIFYYGLFAEVVETITFSTSIVNCILYVSMSKKFRITFLNLFCPGCVLRNRPDWLITSTRIGSKNPQSDRKPTDVSSHQQRDASSHLQRDASSKEHIAELYGPDQDEIYTAISDARHSSGSDQHRLSVDSTSV